MCIILKRTHRWAATLEWFLQSTRSLLVISAGIKQDTSRVNAPSIGIIKFKCTLVRRHSITNQL